MSVHFTIPWAQGLGCSAVAYYIYIAYYNAIQPPSDATVLYYSIALLFADI